MSKSKELGDLGECRAVEYLTFNRLEIIGTKIRLLSGEIDIIAKENDCIVFVEVKTRSYSVLADPEAAMTRKKVEHLIACAEEYMQSHPELGDNWRIDVISITNDAIRRKANIIWYKNAISN